MHSADDRDVIDLIVGQEPAELRWEDQSEEDQLFWVRMWRLIETPQEEEIN